MDPNAMMFRADKESWNKITQTIDGKEVVLVATRIPRNPRKYRTVYIYNISGTNIIIFNRGRSKVMYMKIAIRPQNMQRFFEIFVQKPLTEKEQEWLARYDYELV